MKTKLKKTGIICGSFDLIHAGYIRMFRDAKENACEKLIVALQSDPTIDRPDKNSCVQPVDERLEILKSIRYIDEILLYDTEASLYELLSSIEYDVRVLGTDYEGKNYTGKEIDPSVYYHHRDHEISTSGLKKRVYESVKNKNRLKNSYSLADLDMRDRHLNSGKSK